MRMGRGLAVIVMWLLLAGCSHHVSETELAKAFRPGMKRGEVAELYRGNLHGQEPRSVYVRPEEGWAERRSDHRAPDPLLRKFERERGVVVQSCDVWVVPRGFMAMGLYYDYVWYGADERLLGHWRRFVD